VVSRASTPHVLWNRTPYSLLQPIPAHSPVSLHANLVSYACLPQPNSGLVGKPDSRHGPADGVFMARRLKGGSAIYRKITLLEAYRAITIGLNIH